MLAQVLGVVAKRPESSFWLSRFLTKNKKNCWTSRCSTLSYSRLPVCFLEHFIKISHAAKPCQGRHILGCHAKPLTGSNLDVEVKQASSLLALSFYHASAPRRTPLEAQSCKYQAADLHSGHCLCGSCHEFVFLFFLQAFEASTWFFQTSLCVLQGSKKQCPLEEIAPAA